MILAGIVSSVWLQQLMYFKGNFKGDIIGDLVPTQIFSVSIGCKTKKEILSSGRT